MTRGTGFSLESFPTELPVIDLGSSAVSDLAERLGAACRGVGFFYVVGHGVDGELLQRLEQTSREFFALDHDEKMAIRMERGGRAWRGYFPVGAELTSGRPDQKEGLYFGAELPREHPLVSAGTPLHGANLFPERPAGLRHAVLETMNAVTTLAHRLMELMALSLGLPADTFARHYTHDPLVLFRIFHYPALRGSDVSDDLWSVGEHTDYGLLTLLLQDESGGLQVKVGSSWLDAPPLPGSFVVNIGDMLDLLTRGLYRSTAHRVRNVSGRDRLSFPLFFDPAWTARVEPLPIDSAKSVRQTQDRALRGTQDSALRGTQDRAGGAARWDGADLEAFSGTYGEYVLGKVGKVFPELLETIETGDLTDG